MMNDEFYMRRCLELAQIGQYYVAPNPMVGAVLVRNDQIVAEGWHQQYGGPHAEVHCFRDAEQKGITYFGDCTLYVSLEPCSHYGKTPPCAKLIQEKKPGRVVVGLIDPNPKVAGRGIAMLQEVGIDVRVGVLESACRELNKRFLCLQEKKRPYIILKWAQTADGFIDYTRPLPSSEATSSGSAASSSATGTPQSPLVISSALTKQLVHKMRAENMAIMVGTRTALLDNPGLKTTRWPGRNPIRVLVDRHNVVSQYSKIFSGDAETIVYRDNTDWGYIIEDLGARNIHSIIVEGGATLLRHILESDIYDEIHVEVSPIRIGDGVAAPQVTLPTTYTQIGNNRIYEWRH